MTMESVSQLSSALVRYILDPGIRSGGLVVVIGLLLFAFRIRDTAAKLTIWKLVLCVALTMPFLAALLPPLSFSFLQPPAPDVFTLPPIPAVNQIANGATLAAEKLAGADVAATLEEHSVSRLIDWRSVATVVYMLIAAIMLGRIALGIFLGRRLRLGSRPITDPDATAIQSEVAIGKTRMARLAESEAVTVPLTLGLKRPLILLPADWREWETQKLRAVLAHEMAHVARKDALVQILSAVHRCFFWFSPVSWWLHQRIAELAEHAADDRAIEVVSDRAYYAEVLLSFFEALRAAPGRVRGFEVAIVRGSAAERRVDGVLSASRALPPGIRRAVLAGALLVIFPMAYVAASLRPGGADSAAAAPIKRVAPHQFYIPSPETDLILEIVLQNGPKRKIRVSSGATTMIVRNHLAIDDLRAGPDFSALDIWADREGDSLKLRVSAIYNDLSKGEWWKEKKEKVIDTYSLKKGESVRPLELADLGIEPVEFKVTDAGLVAFKPGEGPRIINNTRALEVTRVEQSLDTYYISLRNLSEKRVLSFAVKGADHGRIVQTFEGLVQGSSPAIDAGGDYYRLSLWALRGDLNEIVICDAVFEDRTFEGDPVLAAQFLAERDGAQIAAQRVLRLIEKTAKADDSRLQAAFDRFEAEFRAIPEPGADRASLEEFKSKFGSYDEKTVMELYDEHYLKSGPESVKFLASRMISSLKHDLEKSRREGGPTQLDANGETQLRRRKLAQLKSILEEVFPNL